MSGERRQSTLRRAAPYIGAMVVGVVGSYAIMGLIAFMALCALGSDS